MVVGVGNRIIKGCLFFFNLIFCIAGLAIVSLGLVVRFEDKSIQWLESKIKESTAVTVEISEYSVALYIIIAIGALLFLTGFLGCCGAACESSCLLALFVTVLVVLLIGELTCGIYLYVKKDKFEEVMKNNMEDLIKKYEENEDIQNQFHAVHKTFKCCGVFGCDDFENDGRRLQEALDSCGDVCQKPKAEQGCLPKLMSELKRHAGTFAGIGIAILAVEVLGILFALLLCCGLRKSYY